MLIKSADDKQPQIDALTALVARRDVNGRTRRGIEQEIRTIRAGAAGEREAAYEIEFHAREHRNWMVIHDLRVEVGGRVAQIDHLIVNRLLEIWVCESKHFAEGVHITEFGEWEAIRHGRREGIPSPVEQNRKHIVVLEDVFARGLVRLPKRLGVVTIKPALRSLVLVSANARIGRPRGRVSRAVDGIETVIKVDQLATTLQASMDEKGAAWIARAVSSETVERVARQLTALHVPATFNWAARFGLPAEPPPVAMPGPRSSNVRKPPDLSVAPARTTAARPRSVCQWCGARVSLAVVGYCQTHSDRFGGSTYCITCQKQFPVRG